MKVAVIAGAVLLLCSTGIASARTDAMPQFTIVGDRIVGGVRLGATLDDATTVLGMPDVQRRPSEFRVAVDVDSPCDRERHEVVRWVGADVRLDQVPKVVVDAVIATEDKGFFRHGGIDPLGIL